MDDDEKRRDPIAADAATAGQKPSVDAERRIAIAKLGVLAAYTAPALLASMTAQDQPRPSLV